MIIGQDDQLKLLMQRVDEENTMLNQRLGWLLTLQGFLFAAAAVLFREGGDSQIDVSTTCSAISCLSGVAVIAAVGLLSSVSMWYVLRLSAHYLDPLNDRREELFDSLVMGDSALGKEHADPKKRAQAGLREAEQALEEAQDGLEEAQEGLDAAQDGLDAAQEGLDAAQDGLDEAQEGLEKAPGDVKEQAQEHRDAAGRTRDAAEARRDQARQRRNDIEEERDRRKDSFDRAEQDRDRAKAQFDEWQQTLDKAESRHEWFAPWFLLPLLFSLVWSGVVVWAGIGLRSAFF